MALNPRRIRSENGLRHFPVSGPPQPDTSKHMMAGR